MAKRSHSAKFSPAKSTGISFDSNIVENLTKLEMSLKEHALRSAAHAGAFVLYTEMQYHVAIKPNQTGKLFSAIYHWFDKKQSTDSRKVYAIGPNKRKAPHWYNVEFGHWRYNRSFMGRWLRSKSNPNARVNSPGTMDRSVHDLQGALDAPVWVPASPYIRNTWEGAKDRAMAAAKKRLAEKISEAIKSVPA